MLEVLLLVIIQSACTNAIVNPWVNPTHRVNPDEYMINGWTPKPTQAPHVPSQLGGMANKGLRRRADIDTCGYIDGDASQPITCDAGYACAYIYDVSPQYWNCCPLNSDGAIDWTMCPNYAACHDYGSASSYSNQGSSAFAAGGTVYCPEANPICYTAWLLQSVQQYEQYGCWTTQTTFVLYAQPSSSVPPVTKIVSQPPETVTSYLPATTSDQQSSSNSPGSASSTHDVPSKTSQITPTVAEGGSATNQDGSSPARNTGTSTASPSPKPSKKTNVGAIAGGVVGGVVALAALGVMVYLIQRKRNERLEPMREVSPGYYAASPSQNY